MNFKLVKKRNAKCKICDKLAKDQANVKYYKDMANGDQYCAVCQRDYIESQNIMKQLHLQIMVGNVKMEIRCCSCSTRKRISGMDKLVTPTI